MNNAGVSNHPIFDQLRALRVFPSTNTERRHVALQNAEGHIRPCRRTGNNRASALRDHDLLLLALYRITYPKATSAEINAFLYRANYGSLTFRFYSPSQISETETWIGLTRKKGSTTAYQALLPINKVWLKGRDRRNCKVQFVEERWPVVDGIHADSQNPLNCVEHILNWSINWVVWGTKY